MSKKLKRSAVALVLAATMVFSSQGVLTAFAVGGDIETEASVSSALEPILDKVETDVADESGNTDETETPEVTKPCDKTEGCTLSKDHEGECQVAPVDPPAEGENGEGETQSCTKTESCTLENGHEGECVTEPVTPPEEENGEGETKPCEKTEGCTLPNGHEGECVVEENTEDTEDTQEPSEEDVAAAVQAVVDRINSLPTTDALANYTPTIELNPEDEGYQEAYQAALDAYYSQIKKDVEAARSAYDALTEEQKVAFDATVLAKLTALEELIAMREQADVLPETEEIDPDTVAIIETGEGLKQYKTLDDAVAAATDGATIEVLTNCTTTAGMNLDKNLTIKGADGVNPEIKFTQYGIALWGKALTFQDCKVTMNGIGSTPYIGEWNWQTVQLGGNSSLFLNNTIMTLDGAGTPSEGDKKTHGIYCSPGASLTLENLSELTIMNYSQDAIEWDGGTLDYNFICDNSTVNLTNCRSGIAGTFSAQIKNGSHFNVYKNRGNGSNGTHFYIQDSIVDFSNNGSHGLSANTLSIQNSDVTAKNNGYSGITATNVDIDSESTVIVSENGDASPAIAAFQMNNNGRSGTHMVVEAGADFQIVNNYRNGMDIFDANGGENPDVQILSGIIAYNGRDTVNYGANNGGGIWNQGNLTLSAEVQIHNNHAKTAGDDIYNCANATITFTEVGSNWVLDDCNHTITGWFDDSKDNRWNVHTGPVHAELYNEFDETTGLTTITGLKALKAAHPYQYDPDAPTEPSEPVDWETSKSKTATNLDKNYESQVTLSLPAKDEQLVSDVVFVLDKSTSTDIEAEALTMLDNLQKQIADTNAKVKVGVVIFNKEANRVLELTELTEENMSDIKTAIETKISSGTNTHAGLLAGKSMLDSDTSVDSSRKYLVFVSDAITYMYNAEPTAINLQNGDKTNVFAGPDNWMTKYGNNNAPANGWTTWFSEIEKLINQDGNTYEVPYGGEYTNFISYDDRANHAMSIDKALYLTNEVYQSAKNAGYHCYAMKASSNADHPWASSFMDYLADGQEVSFEEIQNDIFYLLDAGSSVIDVIGGDDNGEQYDYDFDFVNDLSKITLTVNGVEKPGVPLGENQYGFGEIITDPDSEYQGHHEYELTYYPNGLGVATMAFENEDVVAGELFVWDIYVPVKQFEPVQLTYTVKLANPKTADGTYGQYDEDGSENYAGLYTNNSAVLFPVDSNGNVGEKEAFDKPTVSYTVSNGKPVEPTPDPDPDPDRPSRPNRDDDDDWEPLPDAPVKDKPTTEVDVPEETETPTTEQPDKYNPETGDTTTVFAAMALAAVSLGGVVLLGRKKK